MIEGFVLAVVMLLVFGLGFALGGLFEMNRKHKEELRKELDE